MGNKYVKAQSQAWVENNVGKVLLNDGSIALFDEDRFAEVSKHNWYRGRNGYVYSTSVPHRLLHRVLCPEIQNNIDHINRNPLDCRSCNLRPCNQSQNSINTGLKKNNTSGVKGVYFIKSTGKWRAMIMKGKRNIHLGVFATIAEAEQARKNGEASLFGEFANNMELKTYF